jgi:hypothetical protein
MKCRDGRGKPYSRCRACFGEYKRDRRLVAAIKLGGENMIAFGSPIQRTSAETLLRCGSVAKAATELGLDPNELRAHLIELKRRAASRGWAPDGVMTETTAEGFHVRGTSTYYRVRADGTKDPVGQWVKTNKDEDSKYAMLLDAMAHIADRWKGKAAPTHARRSTEGDLLCVYPMGDPHLGLFSWRAETGQDFDLNIAERNLVTAVDHLVGLAPAAEEALVINLGDFFHSDNNSARTTRSQNTLDVDTRWAKVLGVGIRTMRRCIDKALEKHARVRVICEIGNHDDHSSVMLSLCLQQYYEREKRVTVDTSPAKFHYHRFGENLVGVTHSDTVKPEQLPLIMAADRREDWGATKHHVWHIGHGHHDMVREFGGVLVEMHGTLAAPDAWTHAAGYRSRQTMKAIVMHKTYGEINRHTIGIAQIIEKAA